METEDDIHDWNYLMVDVNDFHRLCRAYAETPQEEY